MEVSKINTTVARSFSFQFHLRSCNTWTATIYKTKYSALFSLIQMHSHLQNTFRVRVMWLSHRDQRKNVKKKNKLQKYTQVPYVHFLCVQSIPTRAVGGSGLYLHVFTSVYVYLYQEAF